ncbi:hypothetical protein GCM10010328_66610 [Streptomyces rubiginosohelvolus]|uniref:Uncharacterized protein n=1 Tax=Streptomyces rubiginosohelvolus TaxID=67362 RepID=A0ABQ3CBI7_9ACTN|nr:hypothetical protein GCM10010328_66610 [Streptomyces pluricolorescens]
MDPGGLEGLDDRVLVGAAAPDGVGEQVQRGGRGRGEHGQVLVDRGAGALGGGLDGGDPGELTRRVLLAVHIVSLR